LIDPLNDPFGRSRHPQGFDLEARVAMLLEAVEHLRGVGDPASTFVASAITAWLDAGAQAGQLDRRFLRVTQRRGSHRTASSIAAELKRSSR
jgi:hypothetical protein